MKTDAMKDYDAIAREIYYCDDENTPDEISIARIAAILRKHDEAEASGECPNWSAFAWREVLRRSATGACLSCGCSMPFSHYPGCQQAESYIPCPAPTDEKPIGCTCGYSPYDSDRCKAHDAPTDEKALREALARMVSVFGFDEDDRDHEGTALQNARALLAREAPKGESKHDATMASLSEAELLDDKHS
jgi:hypothetical protein